MDIKFSYANCKQNAKNKLYPNTAIVNDITELPKFMKYDYTFIEFKDGLRKKENFVRANYATFDLDNDHSEREEDWIKIEDIKHIFPGVWCLIITSRNHMKEKEGRKPRPKFHVVFKINEIKSADSYKEFMHYVQREYSFFDKQALDAGRFMFGTDASEFYEIKGDLTLSDHMKFKENENDFAGYNIYEGEIYEGSRSNTMIRVATSILKRYGDTDEAYQKYLEQADRCIPSLPDNELETIYASAKRYYEILKKKPNYIEPSEYNKPIWEDPIPLEEDKTPPFPVETLPCVIRDYVKELSESTQTPVDMAASCGLAILSLCCQGKYKIRGKIDWIEPVNLYTVIVAEPSERKSAIISHMTKPLINYEQEYNDTHRAEFEKNKAEKRMLEKRLSIIEQSIVRGKGNMDDLEKITNEIALFKDKSPLKLYVDDVTTEKLNHILSTNDGKAAIISSEGGIFDLLAGIYTKNVNIDVFLKAYSGDTIRVDRLGRECEVINNPRLSVLLAVQPTVLKGLVSNNSFRGRGLTARFLYSYPTSKVGDRLYRTKLMSEFTYGDYEDLIYNILDDEENSIITLSEGADQSLEDFANELEPHLITDLKQIGDWAGKLVGNVLRISGLLARANMTINHTVLEDKDVIVSEEQMRNAIKIGKYYLEHAKVAFSLMGSDAVTKDSIYIIDFVKKTGLAEFSVRDLMRGCRCFKTKSSVMPAINHLIDYGYIQEKASEPTKQGRPLGTKYLVNPNIFNK